MSDKLLKEIRKARPKLRLVSPNAFWFIALMGVFNILLGISFLAAVDAERITASLLIVNDLLTFKFWGVVFIALGIFKLATLKLNNWKWARRTLSIGVSIKAAWMIALVIRSVVSPGTVFVSLLWATIALAQMICYIFFLPPQEMRLFSGKKIEEEK